MYTSIMHVNTCPFYVPAKQFKGNDYCITYNQMFMAFPTTEHHLQPLLNARWTQDHLTKNTAGIGVIPAAQCFGA